ncbi:MAG: hypothetical protein KF824_10185 [Fimbriimonadaceae bacterium]|nr:MAG: hypothetical protein KF824_10185 [Fimbriimonadaceae bacterium]
MSRETPRIKRADKYPPPFKLKTFSANTIRRIAEELLLTRIVRENDDFTGTDWERAFAAAIGAEWKPSNVGLDDVVLGTCCWGAKSVKSTRPLTQSAVRLISGRNSLDYSFEVSNVRELPPEEVGTKVLDIWNERVSQVRAKYRHARTAVLVKGPGLLSGVVFEFETDLFDPTQYTWQWNSNKNLVGFDLSNSHKFTWQPHGSQFTVVETIPATRHGFTIRVPDELPKLSREALLSQIGYKPEWIEIKNS